MKREGTKPLFQQTVDHENNTALVSTGMFKTFKGESTEKKIHLIASKWQK